MNLDSRQIYFVNQIVEYIVHNGMMKDLSVLQETPFTDQGSIVEVFTDLSVWMGIRKIMGSTSGEVFRLMLRTFCAPLVVSFVVAVPIAWHFMSQWLEGFSYRITLSPWFFVATCLFSLFVAVISVGIQILRAVTANPVESIKVE